MDTAHIFKQKSLDTRCGECGAWVTSATSVKVATIDLYHAVAILVMFPLPITVMNANIHCAYMAPDYYYIQPQFGYNELEWSKIKMAKP